MVQLFANSGDPDETPRFAASDLGLHYLPITILGVSRLQWVNVHYDMYAQWRLGSSCSLTQSRLESDGLWIISTGR